MSNRAPEKRGQVVLITGGGKGIGRLLATEFARSGSRVAIASRTKSDLDAVLEELATIAPGQAHGFAADVRSDSSVDALFDSVTDVFGRVDVLVNNAGVYINRPAHETSEEEWDIMIDTNLKGVFLCSRRAAQEMSGSGGGRIVSISSVLSHVAQHGYAAYGASKAGVEQLTRVLALEFAHLQITVNAVAPTSTITRETAERLSTPESLARAESVIPLGRFCDASDVIGAVMYFAGPDASFVTGQTLYVDGGFSLP